MYDLLQSSISKVQHITNAVVRLLTRTEIFDHITFVLISLHWFPMKERINFNVLYVQAPEYMRDMLQERTNVQTPAS